MHAHFGCSVRDDKSANNYLFLIHRCTSLMNTRSGGQPLAVLSEVNVNVCQLRDITELTLISLFRVKVKGLRTAV